MLTNRTQTRQTKLASWLAGRLDRVLATGLLLLWFTVGLASWAEAVTPGTPMVNRASVRSQTQALSATATAKAIERTPSQLDFFTFAPGTPEAESLMVRTTLYSQDATATGSFVAQAAPQLAGATHPIDLDQPLPLLETGVHHAGSPLFLRLTDPDQNLYPTIREIVLVLVRAPNGDNELLKLEETEGDSGIFTGYLITSNGTQAPVNGDGRLFVASNDRIEGLYTDPVDGNDSAATAALIDPLGRIFDSSSGTLINGATITLVNTDGSAATVYGDDGFSRYPSTLVSGGSVTDSSGNEYQFKEGEYRFPFIAPGQYRLRVVPPSGYGAPSAVPDQQLQALPGAPYAIGKGSRGEQFDIGAVPIVHIDIPVDPADGLWLQKFAGQEAVTIGEFLQYRLELENTSETAVFKDLQIVDRLPLGFSYREGSTRLNGQSLPDPTHSPDGRTLTFLVGNLNAADKPSLTYVVEVGAGSRSGQAINRAHATDGHGNVSNQASAAVTVREAFARDKVFLLGKVLQGTCSAADTDLQGVHNARIYLEDGTYVDSDEQGRFHFEGVAPGVHVVQLDIDSLPPGYEAIPCNQSSQFAGRTFSQFVDLKGGTLWNTNFYVQPTPPPTGEVALAMSGSLTDGQIAYRVKLKTAQVSLSNMTLNIMLPAHAKLLEGTARLDGDVLQASAIGDGTFSFMLGDKPAEWSGEISFRSELDPTLSSGQLSSKAVLLFDTPAATGQQTPLAEVLHRVKEQAQTTREEINLYPRFPTFIATLQESDMNMLDQTLRGLATQDIIRVTVIGHTDNVPISPESRHIYADNLALSKARAEHVAQFLTEQGRIPAEIILTRGMGATLPVADNKTEAGRALNRRVDLVIESEQAVQTLEVETVRAESGTLVTATTVQHKGTAANPESSQPSAEAQGDGASQNAGILKPANGSRLPHALKQVTIRLDKQLTPKLFVDGREVSSEKIGAKIAEGAQVLYSYVGVDFGAPGLHTLKMQGVGPFGNSRFEQSVEVVRTDDIVAIRQVSSEGNLADGRTPVRLTIELLDKAGQVIPAETQLELRNTTLLPRETAQQDQMYENNTTAPRTIQVSVDGVLEFKPVDKAGEYQLTLVYNEAELEASISVSPKMRDWILVGFAEGTAGYNTFSGNQASLEEAGIDEHFYDDGQVKFFAKGAIKGEWLLTMAYDSDKPDRDGETLHQIIDPDTYYPLYGDGTRQGYEAASANKLFVKLERDQFYALFGDMDTGLNQAELSRYNRSMNGFKSALLSESFSYTLFAADTRQAFAKDEIRGDGTSGRYYLSQKNLVHNSESVTIETRDRFHSEQIIDEQALSRHTDYDVDYDQGSLYFKRPVPSKDDHFNPTYIVVRYETLDSEEANLNYGGRVAAKLVDRKIEIGTTYVHEQNGTSKSDLYGTDITVQLTPQTALHAEAAATATRHEDVDSDGESYLVEVRHASNQIKGTVFYREQQGDFGLGQQNDSETGTRKYGIDGSYQASPQITLSGQGYHEDNLATGAKRDVAEIDSRYSGERFGVHTGLRGAQDRFDDGQVHESNQWLIGGNWTTPDRKLNLRGDYEQSLGRSNENSDFPTLMTLGADYRLTEKVGLFAEQEFSWGAAADTAGTRTGFKATPWQGGDLRTTVEQQTSENRKRVFALFGLGQNWQVNEFWSIDASIDRSHTIKTPDSRQLNENVPAAHGADDDFTAVSVGATRKISKWTWWNRLEARQAESEDKYGISTSVVGEPQNGVAVSAKALAFIARSSGGARHSDGNIRIGLAYRPAASRWILLNRLDFYFDQRDDSNSDYENWRIVNNLHANFRLNRKLQMSFFYGLKYVRDNYDSRSYSSFTDLIAFETRYNITKRWDVGLHGSMLHSWNSNQYDYSLGADIGYSPTTNTWFSLGYNVVGFEDEDFSAANYTAEGAYMRLRAKFDQQSVRDAAKWINR